MRYRATDPPVDPFSPGHQLFVNQVSAQGCVVGVDGTKQLVDFRFRVPDAGFEYLSDFVEQLYPPRPPRRHRLDHVVANESAKLYVASQRIDDASRAESGHVGIIA